MSRHTYPISASAFLASRRIYLLFVVAFLTACAFSTPYQQRGIEKPNVVNAPTLDQFEEPPALGVRLDAEARSLEYFSNPPFMVGIVEIDEQGNANPAQYAQTMAAITDSIHGASLAGRKTTLVTFIHGWHHGCRTCDDNLTCFRRVLAELGKEATKSPRPRNIVGVYIGWRGRLFLGKADVISIWSRKSVAERIGKKGGKEILTQLRNIWADADGDVTMVTVGHSLGGALLLSSVRYGLTGNVDNILRGGAGNYRIVRASGLRANVTDGMKAKRAGFGDLIVLMNPAIEAVQYEVFDSDLRDEGLKINTKLISRRLPPDKFEA